MPQRQSNIELLRILSIFLITMHHLVVHGADACGYLSTYMFDQGKWGIIINSFCIVGVNVFILISGWFGIKSPIKASVHLIFTFIVLSTLMNVGLYLCQGGFENLNIITTYKFTRYWFLYDYILLALISPYVERSIKYLSYRVYTILIIMATLMNVIVCYWFEKFNSDGYGLLNFIYLYYLARYIRRMCEEGILTKIRSGYFALSYFVISIILAAAYFLLIYIGYGEIIGGVRYFSYNNPLVLLSSCSLFAAFATSKPFYSNWVNTLAKGVFSVYIVQTSLQLCGFRVLLSKAIYADYSYIGLFVFGLAILIGCSVVGVLVEKMWKYIESKIKPILDIWKDMY